jgi:uncharacterized repeat protein (TIGR01451 family)
MGQAPFTVTANTGVANISSVTSCNGDWIFSFDSDAEYGCIINISNATQWTFSGLGFSYLDWGVGAVGTNDGTNKNIKIYGRANTTTHTMVFSTTAPTCGPKITIGKSEINLIKCNTDAAFPSKNFEVKGSGLNAGGITVSFPNTSVLFNGVNPLTISKTDGENGTIVTVSFTGTAPASPITGNITITALDNTAPDVKLLPLMIENLTGPSIVTSYQNLYLNYLIGSTPEVKDLEVQGMCLSGNLTITPPAGFQISLSSTSGFGSGAITVPPTATTIYVRIDPAQSTAGTPSGPLTFSDGSISHTVTLNGSVQTKVPETFYVRQNGNWSSTATWSTSSCSGAAASAVPTAVDNVIVCGERSLTVDGDYACASISMEGGNSNPTLSIAANQSLSVKNNITVPTASNSSFTMSVGNGATLSVGGSVTATGGNNKAAAVTVGNNAQVNIGGNWNVYNNNATNTLTINSGATFAVVGSFSHKSQNNATTVTVNGTLSSGGDFEVSTNNNNAALAINGTVIVGGNFSANTANTARTDVSGSGTLNITENFQYGNAGGTWTATGLTMDMSKGCGQTLAVNKAVSVSTFVQSASCPSLFSKSGSETFTVSSVYNQNCNQYNLAQGVSGMSISGASLVNDVCVPTITLVYPSPATLTGFAACYNEASASQEFAFFARALKDVVKITVTGNYEISSDDLTYSSTLTFPAENTWGNIALKTLYVRLKSGGVPGTPYSGTITLTTADIAGGIDKTILLNGQTNNAQLTSPSSTVYVANSSCVNTASAPSTFVVRGSCIPVNITLSTDFAMSTSASGPWMQSLNGVADGTTIYIRTQASAVEGEKTGTISFYDAYQSGSTLLNTFDVRGSIIPATITFSTTAVRLAKACVSQASPASSFVVNGLCSTAPITVTVSTLKGGNGNFEISTSQSGPWTETLTNLASGTTLWVRSKAAAAIGNNEGVLTASFTTGGVTNTTNVAVTGIVSGGEITVLEDPFFVGAYVQGSGPSLPKALGVETSCLNTAGIALSLNTSNFTLSQNTIPSPYSSTVNLRVAAGLSVGNYSGVLTLTAKATDGTTAVSTTVNLTGRVLSSGCAALPDVTAAININFVGTPSTQFKLNAKEYQIAQGDAIQIFTQTPAACYSVYLEKKDLTAGNTTFLPTYLPSATCGANTCFNFIPTEGASYRIRYHDNISGQDYYTTDILVRVKYKCNCDHEQSIFADNFGSFTGARSYVSSEKILYTNIVNQTQLIADYFAPEPYGFIKNHEYRFDADLAHRMTDNFSTAPPYDGATGGGQYSNLNLENWCGQKLQNNGTDLLSPINNQKFTKRVVDGTYALLQNPEDVDCANNDYWSGSDHTGNGAMLFVNVANNALGKVIYQRDIALQCTALQNGANIVFTAFINNAVRKLTNGSQAMQADLNNLQTVANSTTLPFPVNVRMDLIDNDPTSPKFGQNIASISSGDLIVRSNSDGSVSWGILSYKFPVHSSAYTIEITNNTSGGAGNDILIDDIDVSICFPQLKIDISRITPSAVKELLVCDTAATVPLFALPFDDVSVITDFIPDPYFQFQYRTAGGNWTNYGAIQHFTDNTELTLDGTTTNMLGSVEWRVIAAERPSMFADIMNNTIVNPTCDALFAISDTYVIRFMPNQNKDITFAGCIGDFKNFTMTLPKDYNQNPYTQWQLVDAANPSTILYSNSDPNPHSNWTTTGTAISFAAPAGTSSASNHPFAIGENEKQYIFKAIAPSDIACDYETTITYSAGGWCLQVDKEADEHKIDFQDPNVYEITVTNTDTKDVTNIVLSDILPPFMDYVSHSIIPAGSTYNATTGDWNIGTLTQGSSVTLLINVKNSGGQGSDIINTSWVRSRNQSVWNSSEEHRNPACVESCAGVLSCIQNCDYTPLIDTSVVHINSPASVVLDVNPVCLGSTTPASVTARKTEPNLPLFYTSGVSYTWDWSALGATPPVTKTSGDNDHETWAIDARNLAAGTYPIGVILYHSGSIIAQGSINFVVNPLPQVTATSDQVCAGNSAAIAASGAASYTWYATNASGALVLPSIGTGSPITVTPSATTRYAVIGSDANSCQDTAYSTVTVNPLPDMTISADPVSICAGSSSNITFTFKPGTPPFTVNYHDGPTPLQMTIQASDPNLVYNSANQEYTYIFPVTPSQTTIYTVDNLSDGNSCYKEPFPPVSIEVTVIQLPSVSITPTSDFDICAVSGSTGTKNQFPLNATLTDATVKQWIMSPTGMGTLSNPTSTNPVFTYTGPTPADVTTITFTLEVDGIGNVCAGTTSLPYTLQVHAPQTVTITNAGAEDVMCEGNTYQLAANVTPASRSIAWSMTPSWGYFNDNTLSTTIYTADNFAVGETSPKQIDFNITVSNNDVCDNATAAYTVNVYAKPTVAIDPALPTEMCIGYGANTLQLNSTSTNGTVAWSWTPNKGSLSSTTISNPVFTPADDMRGTIALREQYFFTLTASNPGCPSVSDNFDLFVYDDPVANISGLMGMKICANEIFQLNTGSSAKGDLLWTHDGAGTLSDPTINNPVYTPTLADAGKDVTFTLTAANGVCANAESEYVLGITAAPEANITTDPANNKLCIVDAAGAQNTFTVDATLKSAETVTWTISPSWGSLSTPVTTTSTSQVVYTPGTFASGDTSPKTVTITITASNAECSAVATDTYTLEIYNTPVATITNTAGASICSDVNFQLTTTIANGTATWTWTPAGFGSLDQSTLVYTPGATTTEQDVVFTLSVSNGVCEDASAQYTLNVKAGPLAEITNQIGAAICVSGSNSTFQLTSNTANGTLAWTHNGAGSLDNATIANPTYTPAAADAGKKVTFTLTVTNPSCPADVATYELEIKALPVAIISNAAGAEICSDETFTFTANIQNGNATWTWTPAGFGSIDQSTLVYTPGTTTSEVDVNFTLTVDNGGVCENATATYLLNVKAGPLAQITNQAGAAICVSGSNSTFQLTSNTANGSIAWTHNGQGTLSSTTINNPVYTPAAGDAGNTVTFTLTVSNTSCAPDVATYDLQVKALPVAQITNTSGASICETGTFPLQTTVANGTHTWSWTPAGYGSLDDPTSTTPTYTPGATTTNTTVVFTLTVSNGGVCTNATASYTLNVIAAPTLDITTQPGMEICAQQTFNVQAQSSNGIVTWTVINGFGTVSPTTGNSTTYSSVAADAGLSVTLRATINSANPVCSSLTKDYVLKVNPVPSVNLSLSAFCNNTFFTDDPITLSGNPSGGTPAYSHLWTVNGGTLTPNNTAANPTLNFTAAQSNVSVTYKVTDVNNCTATATRTISVQAQPQISIAGDIPLCMGEEPGKYTVQGHTFPSGTQYLWDALIDGMAIQPTTTTNVPEFSVQWGRTTYHAQVRVQVIPPASAATCTPIVASSTGEFAIYEKPFAIITGPLDVCQGETAEYVINATGSQQSTTTYTWNLLNGLGSLQTNQNATKADITWNYAGNELINLHMVNGACQVDMSPPLVVSIHPLPQPDFTWAPVEKIYYQSDKTYRFPDEIYPGKEVRFENESTPLQTPVSYYWDFAGDGVFTETTTSVNENVFFTYDQSGDYTATLHMVDEQWGCRNDVSKPIHVGENPNCGLKFPNVFMPDKNESFYAVYNEGVLEWGYELRIYDRWGTQLWSSTDKSAHWDGYYKGQVARQDVYVYHCKATCEETDSNGNHRELNIKGDVTIIR